jgi:hypothetical protein
MSGKSGGNGGDVTGGSSSSGLDIVFLLANPMRANCVLFQTTPGQFERRYSTTTADILRSVSICDTAAS